MKACLLPAAVFYLHPFLLALLLSLSLALIKCKAAAQIKRYPPADRTIFLHAFSNQSFQPSIQRLLQKAIRKALYRRGNFILQQKQKEARLWLYGEVRSYRKIPAFRNHRGEAERYEFFLRCRIQLRHNPKHLHSGDQGILFSRNFETRVFLAQNLKERETTALERLGRLTAAAVNQSLEEAYAAYKQNTVRIQQQKGIRPVLQP